jgi:hypothetical protein
MPPAFTPVTITFEEFQKADTEELMRTAKNCFNNARGSAHPTDTMTWLAESQFYMAEIARRENNADSEKSHRMERIIIWLIVLELLLAIVGIGMDVGGGREEVRALGRIERALAAP